MGCTWRCLHSSLDRKLLYYCMPRWAVTLLSTHSPMWSCCAIVAAGLGAAPQQRPGSSIPSLGSGGGCASPFPFIFIRKEGERERDTS